MSSIVFRATTRVEAWLASTEYLLVNGDSLNVILDIAAPAAEGKAGRKANEILDALYLKEKQLPIHAIAETIFPAWEYLHRGVRGVYSKYPGEYKILKKGSPQRWGTYAHRLVSRTDAAGRVTNPLGNLVAKMRRTRGIGRVKYRTGYEIGVGDEAHEIPLYDNNRDQNRLRGAPCLTHLSFKLVNDSVHLTALYRSHDYRYKVPGNLLGLARLQAFVAQETGSQLGNLVIHSTLAYVDPGMGKGALKKALVDIGKVLNGRK